MFFFARSFMFVRFKPKMTHNNNADVDVDEKHERRRVASLSVSLLFKNSNKLTLNTCSS